MVLTTSHIAMVGPAILPLVFEDARCEALSFTETCKRGRLRRRGGRYDSSRALSD
jgi:hypothetical protein